HRFLDRHTPGRVMRARLERDYDERRSLIQVAQLAVGQMDTYLDIGRQRRATHAAGSASHLPLAVALDVKRGGQPAKRFDQRGVVAARTADAERKVEFRPHPRPRPPECLIYRVHPEYN